MLTKETWEDVKLLCPPIIWFCVTGYVWKLTILPLVLTFWPFIAVNLLLWMVFLVGYCKIWWYKETYTGNVINVREPIVGWDKMQYDVDPSELGEKPFGTVFFWHLSSVVIPMEAVIHMFMGSDLQRASVNGDNTRCMGMMTQEMNHASAQLFYNRAAEECCGYPEGFRLFWRTMLLKVASSNLRAAILTWIEVSFIVPQLFVHFTSLKPSDLFGEPKWLWTWHLMEESEHSWDYTREMGDRISRFYMVLIWAIFAPFTTFVWVMSLLQGFYYAFWTFVKYPTRIVTGTLFHCTVFVQMMMCMVAISFLEMVLGMRPDKINSACSQTCKEEYAEYEHLFKTTHTQIPTKPLTKVDFQGPPPRSSVMKVKAARQTLYLKVREMMTAYGLSESQIKRTSFTIAAEANKHNSHLE